MIEIPESYSISKDLHEKIISKKIISVITEHSPHKFAFFYNDPKEYNNLLKGKTITDSKSYGGFIDISAENTTILLGEGGIIRYLKKDEEAPLKHQLLIKFEDLSSIVVTTQMYSALYAFSGNDFENEYYDLAKIKPSPLSDDFNRKYFEDLILECRANTSIKSFLATKQRIPGLGNGTLQDILFNAKIHPKSIIKNLTKEDKDRLFLSVKNTLKDMACKNGRDTEKRINGQWGDYKTILSSKTFNNPCPICESKIIKENYLGGTIYYCPDCQIINK